MAKIITNCILLFCLASAGWAVAEPQEQLDQMIQSVLEVLQRDELSTEEKKEQVSRLVQKTLNVKSMAKRVLGASWIDATEDERQRFTTLFVQVLERTYLNRLSDYSGGEVIYLQQRIKGSKAIIDTKIFSDGMDIPVRYKMVLEGGRWQIFDVDIEGVSLVRNYRSSYSDIIRRDGYVGLFALMEKKISTME